MGDISKHTCARNTKTRCPKRSHGKAKRDTLMDPVESQKHTKDDNTRMPISWYTYASTFHHLHNRAGFTAKSLQQPLLWTNTARAWNLNDPQSRTQAPTHEKWVPSRGQRSLCELTCDPRMWPFHQECDLCFGAGWQRRAVSIESVTHHTSSAPVYEQVRPRLVLESERFSHQALLIFRLFYGRKQH